MEVSQASSYDKQNEAQKNVGIHLLSMLEVTKCCTVLDLGCGVGNLTSILSKKVGAQGKVVAVDPDGERLKIARERNSASNIEYIQADDQTFPLGQYDVIFCNTVIHWIHDKETLFKRVYNNLCPGGCFAFTTIDGSFPLPEIGKQYFDELVRPGFLSEMYNDKKVIEFLKASEYESLASDVGFTNISITVKNEVDDFVHWQNIDLYIDALYGWFQGYFDPKAFDKEKLEMLKEHLGDGPIFLPEPIRSVYAILIK